MPNVPMLTLSLLTLCVGCASNPDAPVAEVSTRTITAQVAAPVACVSSAQVPQLPAPTPIDVDQATVDQKVAALAADAIAARETAIKANALLLQCSQPQTGVTP